MERRNFLKLLGSAGLTLPTIGGLSGMRAFAQSLSNQSPFARLQNEQGLDRILVIVRLFGGNDGLSTVVPYTDDNYYRARRYDASIDISVPAEDVLKLPGSNTLGLHPSLQPLLPIYTEGKIAIVQNVGYPNQDLSHFRSTDIWLSATDPETYELSGWMGRYLEERYPEYPERLPESPYAIELDTITGRSLNGRRSPMGFTLSDTSYIPDMPDLLQSKYGKSAIEEAFIREGMRQSNVFLNTITKAQQRVPVNNIEYPNTTLAQDLAAVSRFIAAGLGTQVYLVNTGVYDFHQQQVEGQKAKFHELSSALAAFQRDIEAFNLQNRVSLITISEFGRRVTTAGSGTDHGGASMLFVMGSNVNGGIIGNNPNISDLDSPSNLRWEYDFRQIYASILGQWFFAKTSEITSTLFRPFTQLPIFKNVQLNPISALTPVSMQLTLEQNIPNPARDVTTIRINGQHLQTDAVLLLYDINGREVHRQTIPTVPATVTVNLRGLASGIYTYRLVTERQILERKMAVTR